MATIAQDTFTSATNINLAAHVPDIGTGWSLELAQFTVIAATDIVQHNSTSTHHARETTTVGADTMEVSASCAVLAASRAAGVCARLHSAAPLWDCFELVLQYKTSTTADLTLYKIISGSRTQLGTAVVNLNAGTFAVVKLVVGSGTQDAYLDGVLQFSATEPQATLAGRNYAGILMCGANTSNAKLDDYLSATVTGITSVPAADTARVTLVEAASVNILTTTTPIAAADTMAVTLVEAATVSVTQIQKLATDTLNVRASEAATITQPTIVTAKLATDTLSVRLVDQGTRGFSASDTILVRAAEGTPGLVKSTPAAFVPTLVSPVWRVTSGNTSLLPNIASRDLEL